MKKVLALFLALTMVLTLVGCQGKDGGEVNDDNKPENNGEKVEDQDTSDKGEEVDNKDTSDNEIELDDNSLYLTTDQGTIDDKSFNQASYEGLKQYADEKGVKANYIRPMGEGDQIYLQAIEQAVDAGAKVVVTPGFLFETAIPEAQKKFPEVKFICVDFEPRDLESGENVVADNTVSIMYKENQPGFLAGYAAVKEGYTNLGFMGGVAVPSVIRYGFGYVAGAAYAGKEMGVDVNVKFHYTGTFNENPEIKTKAASWYKEGTEIIFVAGGGIYRSIISAAADADTMIIGVDSDQKDEGPQVLTSALKNVKGTVYENVKKAIEGGFPGGESLHLGIEDDAIGLPEDFSRFNNFNEDDYQAILKKLKDNEDGILDNLPNINFDLPENEQSDPTFLEEVYDNLKVDYVK